MKRFIKNLKVDTYILFLTILSIGFLASLIRYSLRSFAYPIWDEQHYMHMAAGFYRLLQNPSLKTPYEMLQLVPFRQPGYSLFMLPFLMVFGLSNAYFWGLFTNGLLYVASVFGVYLIARNYVSKLASFLAAFIFMFYGWTLFLVHFTYSETATSALSIWIILFLVKSNCFQNRKYSLLFGVFLGIGLLTRWVTIIFISGPIIYTCYQILKKRLFKNNKVLIHALLSFFIAFTLSLYPYYVNSYWMFQYFITHRVGGPVWQSMREYERNPFSIYSLTFYLNSFGQLGIYYFLLIIVGLILALRRKSKLKLIVLVVIVSWVFFSFFSIIKGDRYIVPIYPYLAILSSSVFDYVKNNKYKISLIIVTVILSVGTFLGTVWGKGPMRQSLYSLPIKLPFGQLDRIYLTAISRPPYIYKISGKEIVDFIVEDSKNSGIANPQVTVLFSYRSLDEPIMTHNLYHQKKPLQINNFVGTIISNPNDTRYITQSVLKNSDYILAKSGKRTDTFFHEYNYKTLKAVITLFDSSVSISDHYEEKVKFWIYQDSSEVTVFKKNREISYEEIEEIGLKLSEILKRMRE